MSSAASSSVSTSGQLQLEEYQWLRLVRVVSLVGQKVLYHVFLWCTRAKPLTQPLDEYLGNLPKDSTIPYATANANRRKFDRNEKEQIMKFASGDGFDISMLYKSISLAGENIADEKSKYESERQKWENDTYLEGCIRKIKNSRNDSFHSNMTISASDFHNKVVELRNLFKQTIKKGKERYDNLNDPNHVDEMNRLIKEVEDEIDNAICMPLNPEDLLKINLQHLQSVFIQAAENRLREYLKNVTHINPVSFFTNLELRVQEIFIRVRLEKDQHPHQSSEIDCGELFHQLHQSSIDRPHLLLLEGAGGSGKTTLVKVIIQMWTDHDSLFFSGLDHYQLLLWVQCQDDHIDSYQVLLDKTIPQESVRLGNLLPRLVKMTSLLVVVDGLDEMTKPSEQLVRNLLAELRTMSSVTFLCTTRPEKSEQFRKWIPRPEYDVTRAVMLGIPHTLRRMFAANLHKEIMFQLQEIQDPAPLLLKIEQESLKDHFKLPLNLALVVVFFIYNPDKLPGITTQTEIYYNIHELCQERVVEKLANHEQTHHLDPDEVREKLKRVLGVLYDAALEGLTQDRLKLSKMAEQRLKKACDDEGLPLKPLISAFFNLQVTKKGLREEKEYVAPHKGIQDYYAANSILNHLQQKLDTNGGISLAEEIEGLFRADIKQLEKYQSVFIHLAGLLDLYEFPESNQTEIVHLLHRAGVTTRDQWLNLLDDTRAAPATLTAIAHYFGPIKDVLVVGDGRVGSYTALLPYLPQSRVAVQIRGDLALQPSLNVLLPGLATHNCVLLRIEQHYYHPEPNHNTDFLHHLPPQCGLGVYVGQVRGATVARLAASLTHLHLAAADDSHAADLLPHLSGALNTFPTLIELQFHVASRVTAAALSPLPAVRGRRGHSRVLLCLSDVDEVGVQQCCDVARALQPAIGYGDIDFPRARLVGEEAWGRVVVGLAGVAVQGALRVPADALNHNQAARLTALTIPGCVVGRRANNFYEWEHGTGHKRKGR